MTNCVNCGAPLSGNKCPYCGTEYSGRNVVASFDRGGYTGTLTVDGKSFEVYIAHMEAHTICADAGRDMRGQLHMVNPIIKRRFTLVEL